MAVLATTGMTRRIVHADLARFRLRFPSDPEKDLWRRVVVYRFTMPGSTPEELPEEGIIDYVIQRADSFDDVCDWIIEREQAMSPMPDFTGVSEEINAVLEAYQDTDPATPRPIVRQTRAEQIIESVQATYSSMRRDHPEADEHFHLASTWMARYGNTDEARAKGAESIRFISYRETYQYAILEPPYSIRGLALYLVYKELDELQALDYVEEYRRIMEPVFAGLADGTFLETYKERNPVTWAMVQEDPDSDLYWFFEGVQDLQEHPGEWGE